MTAPVEKNLGQLLLSHISLYIMQAVLECVREAVGERERERGLRVLLRLSQSLAVQQMTNLPGTYIQ